VATVTTVSAYNGKSVGTGSSGDSLKAKLTDAIALTEQSVKRVGPAATKVPSAEFLKRTKIATKVYMADDGQYGTAYLYLDAGPGKAYEAGIRHPLNWPNQVKARKGALAPFGRTPLRPFLATAMSAVENDVYDILTGVIDDWLRDDGWDMAA
jgi:hypothetical protein